MNQVLSQSEVDALLAAVSDGEVQTADNGGGNGNNGNVKVDDKKVVAYDLTSQDRIIRGRLPQLEVIYEKFMRAFRVSLSSSLRKIASISLTSTEFLKFGEFINTLPMPTCMSVLRFVNLRGSALMVIESKLAYALVDSFFGGAERPFTKIDGKEQNPQFVGIVPPTDVVIASTFDVELENAAGTISMVVPYATIEPIKQKLSSGFQVESDQTDKKLWTAIIKEQLMETSLDIKVHLGETEIRLSDLMELKVGDVIPLTQDATGELDIQVESVKKFKGYYGNHHGTVAVQITRPIEK
jgi:flagellar motor switch protein FliM